MFLCGKITRYKYICELRYVALYHSHMFDKIFTKRNILAAFLLNICVQLLIYTPFVIYDASGLDDLGLCGIWYKNNFLQIWSQLGFLIDMSAYAISVFCAYKILKIIRNHKARVGRSFEVKFPYNFPKKVYFETSCLFFVFFANVSLYDFTVYFFQSLLIRESSEISHLMILLMVIPLFTQMPTVVMKYLQIFIFIDPWISRSSTALFTFTPILTPFLIVFKVKKYRTLFRKAIFGDEFQLIAVQDLR